MLMNKNKPSTINHRLLANLGFTLIELLVVISIIGVLATIVIASYGGAQAKARDSQRIKDLDGVKYALVLYKNDNGKYPPNVNATPCDFSASTNVNGCLSELVAGKYMSTLPTDPKSTNAYSYFDYSSAPVGNFGEYGVLLTAELENYSGTGLSGSFRKDGGPNDVCAKSNNGWYCVNLK